MSEIRTHEQFIGIVCTLAAEAHNDCEQEREEYGTQTRQAMRWLEATDAALRAEVARLRAALREIAKGEHGEYCGERNWLLTAGGKTKCFADCPVNIARAALAEVG